MEPDSEKYHLLSDDDELLEDEPTFPLHRRTSRSRPRYLAPLILALIGSICLNVFLSTRKLQSHLWTGLGDNGKSYFGIQPMYKNTNENFSDRESSWAFS